jgi:hypothetical protein
MRITQGDASGAKVLVWLVLICYDRPDIDLSGEGDRFFQRLKGA